MNELKSKLLIILFLFFGQFVHAQLQQDSLYIFEIPKAIESISDLSVATVKIKLCVDRNGNVVSTVFEKKGSTTTDEELIKIAKENASQYKFEKVDAPDLQCGTIQYDFKVKEFPSIDTTGFILKNN